MFCLNKSCGRFFRSITLSAMTAATTVNGGIIVPSQTLPQVYSDQVGIRRPRANAESSMSGSLCFDRALGSDISLSAKSDLQNCVSHSASASKVVLITGAAVVVVWLIYLSLHSIQNERT